MTAGINKLVGVFFPFYAILDLAGGTVLGRGNVATSCRLDAARIVGFSDAG
jgi:hypothetical protein